MDRDKCLQLIESNLDKLTFVKEYLIYLYNDSIEALINGGGGENQLVEKGKARAYKEIIRLLTRAKVGKGDIL